MSNPPPAATTPGRPLPAPPPAATTAAAAPATSSSVPKLLPPSMESAAELASRDSVKVILLGDSAVGKSKLIERFLMDDYKPQQDSTYALTLYNRDVELDGKVYPLDFWDTAGQERFANMHPSYYHRAHCCMLVFDVIRQLTYEHLGQWYAELRTYCKDIPCILIANKIDEDYSVTRRVYKFGTKHNLPFYFVSASDGTNVVKVFNEAIKLGVEYKAKSTTDAVGMMLELLKEDGFDIDEEGASPP